jgi:hypothetical protein
MIDNLKIYLKELIGLFRKGIGGKSDVVKLTITTSAGAYAANDVVGGVLTVDGLDVATKTGIIQNLFLKDTEAQNAAYLVLIYDKHPVTVGGATCTDSSTFAIGSSMPYLVGTISIAGTDYVTVGADSVVNVDNIGKVVKTLQDGPFYIVLVTSGTPTYGSSSTVLSLNVGLLKD